MSSNGDDTGIASANDPERCIAMRATLEGNSTAMNDAAIHGGNVAK
ncbi:MAG TPA: hypothetical protein VNG89_24190 [Vicinamibacterales bacterium]|nr:hypothetical protein [Vicinamibacterales bacterium]